MCASWFVRKVCKTRNWVDGVTLDDSGNVFFTVDSTGLWYWNSDKSSDNPVSLWRGNKDDGTDSMRGVVWNGNTKLYICEERSFRVLQYDIENQQLTTLTGTGEQGHRDGLMSHATFWCPWGIAMDRYDNIYITDQHCIRKINLSNRMVETIAGSASWVGGYKDGLVSHALFRYLTGILVLEDGTMFASDSGNGCIRKIKDGLVTSHPADPTTYACFGCPRGLERDCDWNLLIADFLVIRRLELPTNSVKNVPNLLHVKYPRSLARRGDTLVIGTLDQVVILENSWARERLLWIAKLKENSTDCGLAMLPYEIIKEIASYVNLQAEEKKASKRVLELPPTKRMKV